ncbi:MAG TPA: HU family DNA-binding protein [Acidimicrobiia bacterium]|nr:HU family DNA-binding protein [Acidimicrobiia bacterium]
MNKTEMAQKLARKTGLTQSAAMDAVDAIFGTEPGEGIIAVELDAGNKVTISGFGIFATKSRSARKGRNPATGAEIMIPARKYAHFTPAKGLKDRVAD